MFLIILLTMTTANVATARASKYIETYNADIFALNDGQIKINFYITGVGTVDKLGAKTVVLQEWDNANKDWIAIKTYSYKNVPEMLISQAHMHDYNLFYMGTSGHSYRAKIYFYAEKGGYDSKEYITGSVIAK